MFEYCLEHLYTVTAHLKYPPEIIGPVPEGVRANFYFTGGTLEGPRVKGKLLPVGGDWLLLRRDGVGIIDVRTTIETDDGAVIYLTLSGVADAGEDGYQNFLGGELPKKLPIRVVPRFQTAHPAYFWMNRVQCLGVGEADMERSQVQVDYYAVR